MVNERNLERVIQAAVVMAVFISPALGEEPSRSSGEIDVTQMATQTVVLRDEQNRPVVGAEVMAYAMRMRERTGHGYWDRDTIGDPQTVISDDQGKAVIEYPRQVQIGPDIFTTRLVTFSVIHADFIKQTVHFDLGPPEAEVKLVAGCEVELSAVDENRKPIEDFGIIMAGPDSPDVWAKVDGGIRRSRAIKPGMWQTLLVKLQEEGPTLFSHVLPLRVQPEQSVRFHNVQLRPGVTVRGMLSENVPRPVEGYVMATSVPLPGGDTWDDENPSLNWYDWAEVKPDGSFAFESLPRTGRVQLIVTCEGWLSTTTVDEQAARSQIMGQLFDISDDMTDVVVQMEPTGTLEISLVTTEGEPFTEGNVGSWPNQRYFKGGSTLLGQRFRTALLIKNQLLPPNERGPTYEREKDLPFSQQVNANGTVTLTGIPIGFSEGFVLSHDSYERENGGERGQVSFTLESPEPVKMRMTVVPAR